MRQALFGWDKPVWTRIEKFSDPSIQKVFISKDVAPSESCTVDVLLEIAESARGNGRPERIKAACIYLRFAQGNENEKPTSLSQAECFHRAANELRGIDVLERAAQCYFSSAVTAFHETPFAYPPEVAERERIDKTVDLALRSAGRAKAQYEALGVDDLADEAHRLQQEVLRKKYVLRGNWLRYVLWVWRVVTGYGTSVKRWFAWLLVSLIIFSIVYGALAHFQLVALANSAPFTYLTTPLYLSVVNLVAFGSYTQIVPRCWISELVLVLQALTSFVLIGTGVTFLARR
jgi:hypothetical protein